MSVANHIRRMLVICLGSLIATPVHAQRGQGDIEREEFSRLLEWRFQPVGPGELSRPLDDLSSSLAPESFREAEQERAGPARPRVHYVLAIDTLAQSIGATTRIDQTNLQRTLLAPLKQKGRLGAGYILQGRQVSPQLVLLAIRKLPVKPADTLFVYYSGHGGITSGEHMITTTHGMLRRKVLRDTVSRKGAQLSIIMTDCCSSYFRLDESMLEDRAEDLLREPKGNWQAIDSLFLRARGVVDVTAARPGEYAGCDGSRGGYFTYGFAATLGRRPAVPASGKAMTWSAMLNQVTRSMTHLASGKQHAFAYSLGK